MQALTGKPGGLLPMRKAAIQTAAVHANPDAPHAKLAASLMRGMSGAAVNSSIVSDGSGAGTGTTAGSSSSSSGGSPAGVPSAAASAAADVTACNGAAKRGRAQRNRESVVPGHELADAVAAATQPGLGQPARISNSISRAPIAMTLMELMQVVSAPQHASLRGGLQALFEVMATGQQQQQQLGGVQSATATLEAAAESAEQEGGSWALAAAAAAAAGLPFPPVSVAESAAGGGYVAPQSGISTGQACQVVPAAGSGAGLLLAAAAAKGSSATAYKAAVQSSEVAKVTLVGMMYMSSVLLLGIAVRVWLDNGCNFSNIGEDMLREKAHYFFRPGSGVQLVKLLRPVQVSLFAGKSRVTASYMLLNVPLGIRKGVYKVNLLVVPESNYGITLGNDFNWAYGATIQSRDPHDREAGRYMILPLTAGLMKPGTPMPERPADAPASWRPRQYVPVNYEVSTEYWQVEKVDSLPPKA